MNVRLIIFDLDGTLYDLHDVHAANYDMQVKFLMQEKQLTKEKAVCLLEINRVYPVITNQSKSATELFSREGLDMCKWKHFREENFDVTKIDKAKATTENVIRDFAAICPLVLLSSNTYQNIKKILDYLGISVKLFDTIYCSDSVPTTAPFNKKQAMLILSEKYNVSFTEILSIGDRYQTDIVPILELGGRGIVVDVPMSMPIVKKDIKNNTIQTKEGYRYFERL